MKALHVSNKQWQIKEFDIPVPGDDQVLIRNVAVASNPKDWKMPKWFDGHEGIEGNDVAGYVEAVGANVKGFQKGDKVAAMTDALRVQKGKWGAYAEYSVAPAVSTFKFEQASFEDMATLPLAVMTAALGLFVRIGLTTPPEDGSFASPNGQVVVINGAASSVGAFGVQLAKHAGYSVVGVAGSSAAVARDVGTDEVVDYRGKSDTELEEAIKEAVKKQGGKLAGAFDCVSSDSTIVVLGDVVGAFGGGKMAHVLPTKVDKDPSILPRGVSTLGSAVFDATHTDDPAKNQTEFGAKWYPLIGRWTDEGKFKPNVVKVIPGGLGGVEEGLQLLETNKVNGVKLVYRIAETN